MCLISGSEADGFAERRTTGEITAVMMSYALSVTFAVDDVTFPFPVCLIIGCGGPGDAVVGEICKRDLVTVTHELLIFVKTAIFRCASSVYRRKHIVVMLTRSWPTRPRQS